MAPATFLYMLHLLPLEILSKSFPFAKKAKDLFRYYRTRVEEENKCSLSLSVSIIDSSELHAVNFHACLCDQEPYCLQPYSGICLCTFKCAISIIIVITPVAEKSRSYRRSCTSRYRPYCLEVAYWNENNKMLKNLGTVKCMPTY